MQTLLRQVFGTKQGSRSLQDEDDDDHFDFDEDGMADHDHSDVTFGSTVAAEKDDGEDNFGKGEEEQLEGGKDEEDEVSRKIY